MGSGSSPCAVRRAGPAWLSRRRTGRRRPAPRKSRVPCRRRVPWVVMPSVALAITRRVLPTPALRAAERGNNGPVTSDPDAPRIAPVVDIDALWVRFGSVDAVRGIDLQVAPGAATALLGRNGA